MDTTNGQSNVLEMKKENVKELGQLMKALHFREFASLFPYNTGLKITVDDGSCQQANAYLDTTFFSLFTTREETIRLKVPLKTLCECLGMAEGATSSVKLTYGGEYEPLRLVIEESDGFMVKAKIETLVPDQELDFEFQDNAVVGTYMLKTPMLKDIFKDFDNSSKVVQISFNQRELSFTTKGDIGETIVTIPKRSLQMETINCEEDVSFAYSLPLLQRMNSSFSISSKVALRVDDRGVLCAQFTVDHGENRHSYIEFLTVPHDDTLNN